MSSPNVAASREPERHWFVATVPHTALLILAEVRDDRQLSVDRWQHRVDHIKGTGWLSTIRRGMCTGLRDMAQSELDAASFFADGSMELSPWVTEAEFPLVRIANRLVRNNIGLLHGLPVSPDVLAATSVIEVNPTPLPHLHARQAALLVR